MENERQKIDWRATGCIKWKWSLKYDLRIVTIPAKSDSYMKQMKIIVFVFVFKNKYFTIFCLVLHYTPSSYTFFVIQFFQNLYANKSS